MDRTRANLLIEAATLSPPRSRRQSRHAHSPPDHSSREDSRVGVSVLQCEFDSLDQLTLLERCTDLLTGADRGWVATVNVSILMELHRDAELARFVRDARFVVPDGQPILWAARLLGTPLRERIAGIDLMLALARSAARTRAGVYLLGGRPGVAGRASTYLCAHAPGLDVRGVESGYFSEAEAPSRARAVAESGARILFLAMGVPLQEHFLLRHWDALGVPLALPVGGSFDVMAGDRLRAPVPVQRAGLEWAYRLVQEPRRLWRRYLNTNSEFLARLTRELVRRHRSPSEITRSGGA